MVNVHEVFSTSITLDEIEKADRDSTSVDEAASECQRICHAGTLLPLKHEHFHHVFIPFSPMLCAFYAGPKCSSGESGETCIYVVRIEADGSHSSVQKLDCPELNQSKNCTPVLFYLNQGVEMRERRFKEGLSHNRCVKGDITTSIDRLMDDVQNATPGTRISAADDAVIALVYKAGPLNETPRSYLSVSCDDGKSFVTPRKAVEGGDVKIRGPVRTKPFLFRKGPFAGRVLFPSSVESNAGPAFVDYTDDDLRTVNTSNSIDPSAVQVEASEKSFVAKGVIQAALFEDLGVHQADDNDLQQLTEDEYEAKSCVVHMLMSAACSQMHVADSYDAGASFGEPNPIELYNCLAGVDCVTYMNRLLVCGKLTTDPEKAKTKEDSPLSIYMSKDGVHFEELLRLEDDPKGTYTSPYMQVDRRHHLLYVAYTDHRKAIKIRIFRMLVTK